MNEKVIQFKINMGTKEMALELLTNFLTACRITLPVFCALF